jgi:hypothetical protein
MTLKVRQIQHLGIVPAPKSVWPAKKLDSAFDRDSRTGKGDQAQGVFDFSSRLLYERFVHAAFCVGNLARFARRQQPHVPQIVRVDAEFIEPLFPQYRL